MNRIFKPVIALFLMLSLCGPLGPRALGQQEAPASRIRAAREAALRTFFKEILFTTPQKAIGNAGDAAIEAAINAVIDMKPEVTTQVMLKAVYLAALNAILNTSEGKFSSTRSVAVAIRSATEAALLESAKIVLQDTIRGEMEKLPQDVAQGAFQAALKVALGLPSNDRTSAALSAAFSTAATELMKPNPLGMSDKRLLEVAEKASDAALRAIARNVQHRAELARTLGLSEGTFDPFYATLLDLYTLFKDPEVANETKIARLDEEFRALELYCFTKCQAPLKTLQRVNEAINARPVQTLISLLKENGQTQISDAYDKTAEGLKRAEKFLKNQDLTSVEHRIKLSIELLRYIVSLREQNLIDTLSSTEARPEAISEVREDIERIILQMKAFVKMGTAIGGAVKNNRELTEDELKHIASAVSDLDLLVLNKMIQSIANYATLVTKNKGNPLKRFQDDMDKMPGALVREIIERDLGKPPEELFIDFDAERPIAAASISQTYKAKMKTWWGGTKEVIIKVQRPNLDKALGRNHVLNSIMFKIGKIVMGADKEIIALVNPALDFAEMLANGFEDSIRGEFDFPAETRSMRRFESLLFFQTGIKVPKPLIRFSGKEVITMEVAPGTNVDTLLTTEGALDQLAREKILSRIVNSFALMFAVGDMHADLHPGNVLATDKGRLGLIDWGQTFRPGGMISIPLRLALNLALGNPEGFTKAFINLNKNDKTFDKKVFAAKVKEIFHKHELPRRSMKELITQGPSDVPSDNYFNVIKEIVPIAYRAQFMPKPTYIQFIRSILPMALVVHSLHEGIPEERFKQILVRKLIWILPGTIVKAVGGRGMELLTRPWRWVDEAFARIDRDEDLVEAQRRKKASRCSVLLAN